MKLIVVNVHHRAEMLKAHLAKRKDVEIRIMRRNRRHPRHRRRDRQRAAQFRRRAVLHLQFGFAVGGRHGPFAWRACRRAGTRTTMDALMLLAPSPPPAIGYDGRGDFTWMRWARSRAAHEMKLAPFVWTGLQIMHPRLFDGAPSGPILDQSAVGQGDRKGRLFGLRLDGVWMHVGTPRGPEGGRRFPARYQARAVMARRRSIFSPFRSAFRSRARWPRATIARAGDDPLALADALVLVPTRRAARTLREAFAEALGGAALGPRIRALGDVGEDDIVFDRRTGRSGHCRPRSRRCAGAAAGDAGAALGRGDAARRCPWRRR